MSEQYLVGTSYTDNDIYHYGRKGMKWGEHIYGKKLKRQLAADKKNLKMRSKMSRQAADEYNSEYKKYQKELSRPSLSSKKKRARINEATARVHEAGVAREKARSEFLRAERVYDAGAKKYMDHVDSMVKKYGAENVKSVRTKTVSLGENYAKDVIRTGITLADMPIVGTWYSGRHVAKQEYADRSERIDKAATDRY